MLSPAADRSEPPQRGLISRVLEPALHLWLRSQVESLETLAVQIQSGDRQILSGYIPQIQLAAQNAVYQGLHLGQVKLNGRNLRINIGQVLKGKPLQLLDPVPVELEVHLRAANVQASLASALLQGAILDVLQTLVGDQITAIFGTECPEQALTLTDSQVLLGEGHLRLSARLASASHPQSVPIALQTGLGLSSPNTLMLHYPEWLPTPQSRKGLPLRDLHGYTLDLGPQVEFEQFVISPDSIYGKGQLTVFPASPSSLNP